MNAADKILKASRDRVFLPTLNATIEVRALRTREMLEAGLKPLSIPRDDELPTEVDEAELERQLLENARNLLVVCAVTPRVYSAEHPMAVYGALCIDDIPDDDVILAYKQIVRLSDTRFYGVNHRAFVAEEHERLYRDQLDMAVMIDGIAIRYHISPLVVESWDIDEISRVNCYIEAAESRRKAKTGEDAPSE